MVYGIEFQVKGIPSQVDAIIVFCTAGQLQETTSISVVNAGGCGQLVVAGRR